MITAEILAIVGNKGGTAKTTTSINLAATLASIIRKTGAEGLDNSRYRL